MFKPGELWKHSSTLDMYIYIRTARTSWEPQGTTLAVYYTDKNGRLFHRESEWVFVRASDEHKWSRRDNNATEK